MALTQLCRSKLGPESSKQKGPYFLAEARAFLFGGGGGS